MKIILVCKKDTSILQKFETRTTGTTFCIFWCWNKKSTTAQITV